MSPLRIAISKASPDKYALYIDWLRRIEPALHAVDLPLEADPLRALAACDALLLTGGHDVDPACYGGVDPSGLCVVERDRDAREFSFIRLAREKRMPILGVCRGMQILNVALGGTLYIDLPSHPAPGHGMREGMDSEHALRTVPGTRIARAAGGPAGMVNSAHHQAVARPAPGLRISAISADGVAEAIEWSDPSETSYLLGVQWHPERMRDAENPFSRGIAQDFLAAAIAAPVSRRS